MAGHRWLFTKEQLTSTPSITHGFTERQESAYRQQAANLIQSMGQRLQLNQLCMNTAIVYMHRFYMYHPLQKFSWRKVASACLFLAAKVEEQPRKLELVIRAGHHFSNRGEGGAPPPPLDPKSSEYLERVQDLVINENILLQTLGFNVTIDHSNTHVVKLCQLVKAPKELSQTSYFLSTNSLLLSNMCLQYPSTTIAAVCIHLACKWSDWELPRSKEGLFWWQYLDRSLTIEKLDAITREFLSVMEKADPKLKKQLKSRLQVSDESSPNSRSSSPAPSRTPQHSSSAASVSSTHMTAAYSSSSTHVHSTGGSSGKHVSSHSVHTSHHSIQPPQQQQQHHHTSSHHPHSSSEPPQPPAKTYAEHRERIHQSSESSSSKSRALHGESPLVRGDLKRSHPSSSSSSSSHHHKSVNSSSSSTEHISSHPHPAHNPYNQAPRNHDTSSRHHSRHHSGPSTEGSPMKKPRLGENGNGTQKPPLPMQPPLPKPPPPKPPLPP